MDKNIGARLHRLIISDISFVILDRLPETLRTDLCYKWL